MSDRTTILLDADIVAMRACCRNQDTVDWGDDEDPTTHADLDRTLDDTDRHIAELRERLDADEVVVCLSDKRRRYFRHDIFPDYKAGRNDTPRPVHLMAVKEHLATEYRSYEKPGLEADDVLGILATHSRVVPGEKIVVSGDKDLLQIPGLHYIERDDDVIEVTHAEGERLHWFQSLAGDPVDGYKGCPQIGPKRANALIDQCVTSYEENYADREDVSLAAVVWAATVNAYAAKGLDEDYALVQARAARILRTGEWDFKREQPILWKAPSIDFEL